jgi:hypothetical protein
VHAARRLPRHMNNPLTRTNSSLGVCPRAVPRGRNSSCSATTLPESATLPLVITTRAQRNGGTCGFPIPGPLLRSITTPPFVISTEAKRSGEISVWILFLGNVFRPEEVMGLRPTAQPVPARFSSPCVGRRPMIPPVGMTNLWRAIFSAEIVAAKTELSSRPERTRISCFALLATSTCAALRRVSRMQPPTPRVSTGNPGERSGGTCGSFRVLTHPLWPGTQCRATISFMRRVP